MKQPAIRLPSRKSAMWRKRMRGGATDPSLGSPFGLKSGL